MAIDRLFERIRAEFPHAEANMRGYSDTELRRIEKLYDIIIASELEQFMLKAGRSDGGTIGDDPLIIYRPSWTVRGQILFQVNFFESMQDIGAWDFLKRPFVISLESETQYYFLQTASNDSARIFHHDENSKTVEDTGLSLSRYLMSVMDRYPLGGPVCIGELINI